MADRPRPSRRGEIPRQYPLELKERAVRLVHETIAEQDDQRHGAVGKVAKQLGIGRAEGWLVVEGLEPG